MRHFLTDSNVANKESHEKKNTERTTKIEMKTVWWSSFLLRRGQRNKNHSRRQLFVGRSSLKVLNRSLAMWKLRAKKSRKCCFGCFGRRAFALSAPLSLSPVRVFARYSFPPSCVFTSRFAARLFPPLFYQLLEVDRWISSMALMMMTAWTFVESPEWHGGRITICVWPKARVGLSPELVIYLVSVMWQFREGEITCNLHHFFCLFSDASGKVILMLTYYLVHFVW